MSYIAIVDYGAGNLMSVHNTLDYLGYENKIAASADVIENAAGVILPGVGAFPDAMAALEHSGLTETVLKAAKEKPFLGICLGMQMLFEESDEVRPCKGLGLLPGRIERIETALKLPQIGWNALDIEVARLPIPPFLQKEKEKNCFRGKLYHTAETKSCFCRQ